MENVLNLLRKTWDEKFRRFGRVLHEFDTSVTLFRMTLPNLGGWRSDSYRAMGSIAVNIALREVVSVHYARSAMFHRHAALLVTSNAACLIPGFDFQIKRHEQE